jgi:uncharacterized protein with FMN-binding domain
VRRAPLVLTATVAGVAGLLSFHPRGPASSAAAPTASPASKPSGNQIDGAVASTQYGDVQVRITVKAGKVVDVTPLALPNSDGRSSEISSFAAPLLRQEVLAAQSGQVDGVSGATYTSQGYADSAASAIAKAGLTSNTASSG